MRKDSRLSIGLSIQEIVDILKKLELDPYEWILKSNVTNIQGVTYFLRKIVFEFDDFVRIFLRQAYPQFIYIQTRINGNEKSYEVLTDLDKWLKS